MFKLSIISSEFKKLVFTTYFNVVFTKIKIIQTPLIQLTPKFLSFITFSVLFTLLLDQAETLASATFQAVGLSLLFPFIISIRSPLFFLPIERATFCYNFTFDLSIKIKDNSIKK